MESRPSITVVYGGIGPERDVSITSGTSIVEGLRDRWEVTGLRLDQAHLPEGIDADKTIVFVALHGVFGEDGQFQRLLEGAGITYVGSDSFSSHICMQKSFSKSLAASRGVPVLPEIVFEKPFYLPNPQKVVDTLGADLCLKPITSGSSTGIVMCKGAPSLQEAYESLAPGAWMIEPRVRGRELTVGLLGGHALESVEITPKGDFYNYHHKYTKGATQYTCPAPLNKNLNTKMLRLAEAAYAACGCRDYARADFMYDPAKDEVYFLELNTIPGFTPLSLLPMTAQARGYSFEALLDAIIAPALSRYAPSTRVPKNNSRYAQAGSPCPC